MSTVFTTPVTSELEIEEMAVADAVSMSLGSSSLSNENETSVHEVMIVFNLFFLDPPHICVIFLSLRELPN